MIPWYFFGTSLFIQPYWKRAIPSQWNFTGRNRRPPLDPINALLSWGYGVLLSRVFASCVAAL
ncbi:CRISPR-associated endonuclease Cas1 [Scytonema sp. NUACC21]